jgi:hypothetical protein
MSHGEPEYRRRARQEAEKNQHYADREWDEATKKSEIRKIVVSVKGIIKELERSQDENTPKNKGERRRHWWEVSGLWAAAVVGAAAIIIGNWDASDQRRIMTDQVREMQTQSAIQRAEIKATLRVMLEPIQQVDGFGISPVWINSGKSDATGVRGWQNIALIPLIPGTLDSYDFLTEPKESHMSVEGTVILGGDTIVWVTQKITNQQASEVAAKRIFPVMYGYIEYRDIFGTLYTIRYCRALPIVQDANSFSMMRSIRPVAKVSSPNSTVRCEHVPNISFA